MNKALLLGTTGIVAAFAMLAVGYLAGKPQAVTSSAPAGSGAHPPISTGRRSRKLFATTC